MQIAKSIQRPGQTKEQTRLVARGIEQGVEQYKKRERAKAKERAKRARDVERPDATTARGRKRIYRDRSLPAALAAVVTARVDVAWGRCGILLVAHRLTVSTGA